MAKSSVYKRGKAQVGFNMTPMIDCTFQLMIFFMLTTQMASAEFVPMLLPKPLRSVAKEMKENKVIVNVVPYTLTEIEAVPARLGIAKEFRVKATSVRKHDLQKVVYELKRLKSSSVDPSKFSVEVRADKRIHYEQVQPILRAIQEALLERMRITALVHGRTE